MYYRYGGSFIGTMTETNRYVQAYREGNVQFVVNQSIWMEGEARYADIVLPACTNFERWDIGDWAHASGYGMHKFEQVNHRLIVLEQKCIEPLGEIEVRLRDLLAAGRQAGRRRHLHRGRAHRARLGQAHLPRQRPPEAHLVGRVRREGLLPRPRGRGPQEHAGAALVRRRPQADTPDWGPPPWDQLGGKGLQTQSGKIEFVSSSLKRFYESGDVVDEERPVLGPQYIESWEGHHTEELTASYPLQLISPHPRFSFHTMGDGKDAWAADIEDHRELKDDGWYYWLIRLNTEDAAARGIAEGDLVRAYNDRGSVVLCARVTEASARARSTRSSPAPTTRRSAPTGTRPTAPAA